MTTKEIAVNGQVYHCPTEWTVEKATDRIKLGYGLQNGGIEQDNVPVLGTALISSLTGDLAFVGGQPIQQLGATGPVAPAVYDPRLSSVHAINVYEIPHGLIEDENESNSASVMFSSEEVKIWFEILINATDLEFDHPEESDNDPAAPRTFDAYIPAIQSGGFKLWNLQSRLDAETFLVLHCEGKYVTISVKPDFLICDGHTVLGNFMDHTRGIVEVQSSTDERRCELQLMLCMYVYMNMYGLHQVVGFLVYTDGYVRAYKAARSPTSIMYEANQRFHVQHINDVFRRLNADN